MQLYLVCFSYFEKTKGGLCDHLTVLCVALCVPQFSFSISMRPVSHQRKIGRLLPPVTSC
jgi:hypothetical protein